MIGSTRRLVSKLAVPGAVVFGCVAACGGKLDSVPDEVDAGSSSACVPEACDDAAASNPAADSGLASPADAAVDGATEAGLDGGGDGGVCPSGPGARFVTTVIDHHFGPGQAHNQKKGFPDVLYGPPDANNPASAVSLGNGGWVILGFDGNAIVDGPGPDFTVFENPMGPFKELATVAVSEDGTTWHEFPCTAKPNDKDHGACAGVARVLSSPTNGVDPLDPSVSGGDTYDLAKLNLTHAKFVKITDRPDVGGNDRVFDLDAVAIVNAECP